MNVTQEEKKEIPVYHDFCYGLKIKQEDSLNPPKWVHLVAGACAGAASRTFTAPIDRLRIYLQVRGSSDVGIKKAIIHMYNDAGILGFWRGNGVNLMKITPEMAAKFTLYNELVSNNSDIYSRFLAGATAGFIAATIVYPLEVLKTRMALRLSYEPKGIIQGFKTMYKNGGVVGGLFKGYTPNIFGVIPYAGIELGVYETMKELFEVQPSGERSTIELLICGAVASFTGQIVVYPLGLVKTKMQSRDFEQYEFGDLVKYIYDNGGARGFYKGLVPSLMRVLPSVMINFLVYEKIKARAW